MSPSVSSISPETPELPTPSELRYFVFGFHKVLKSYRTMTLLGWSIVATGCACAFLLINAGRGLGPFGIVMAGTTICSGLAFVWQSISTLESYLHIVLPFVRSEATSPVIASAAEIMKKVDEGGWQEAYAAIHTIEQLQNQYGLHPTA